MTQPPKAYPDLHEYPKTISITYGGFSLSVVEAKQAVESEYPGCEYQLIYPKGVEKILAKTKKAHPKIVSGVKVKIDHPSFWSKVYSSSEYDHGYDEEDFDLPS